MLRFVFRKMFNKKWMILGLIVGNILLISIALCNPMYINATTQRILVREFSDYLEEHNEYPASLEFNVSMLKKQNGDVSNYRAFTTINGLMEEIPARFGVDEVVHAQRNSIYGYSGHLASYRSDVGEISISIGSLTDFAENCALVAGDWYRMEADEDGVYDAMVTLPAFIRYDLMLGDVIRMDDMTGPDGEPLAFRIVGIVKAKEGSENFWVDPLSSYSSFAMIPEETFERLFFPDGTITYSTTCKWYMELDFTQFNATDAVRYVRELERLESENDCTANFGQLLDGFLIERNQAATTLRILQLPLYALLLAFIFMVSRQILEIEQNEIAVLKSRGAGKWQLILIYFIQSALIAGISIALALPLGAFICQAIGSSNAFLAFVSRASLAVRYTPDVLVYAAVAALVGICVMTLPVFKYSDVSIVSFKVKKNARSQTAWWQKACLDLLLLGVALYGLYTFDNQKDLLAARVAAGESLDPLLYVCSSLFMVGASLFALRVIPLLVDAVYLPLRDKWGPALYASFLTILRQRKRQRFMMVFIMMTVALGIFSADCASSINVSKEEQLRYNLGADVVFKEAWKDNSDIIGEEEEVFYTEPDITVYRDLDGVASVARVYKADRLKVTGSGVNVSGADLMAINTREFGQTCYMKPGLNAEHINFYLNELGQTPYGVLLSRNFQREFGVNVGDTILFFVDSNNRIACTVVDFVDYFPTYNARKIVSDYNGNETEVSSYLIVANLGTVQAKWGVLPYEVWVRSETESTQFLYDFAASSGKQFFRFEDATSSLIAMKNNALIQGTNGILTIGFIVVLMLCVVGFLIYWILSIQSRALQFGIYRAMGMSVGSVIRMLTNEQIWISGASIGFGVLIGRLASLFYIPLIQLAYSSADSSLPLAVITSMADHAKLYGIIFLALLACMMILVGIVRKNKIAQSLKLGED